MRTRILLAFALAIMLLPFAQANWMDPAWLYRAPIAISNGGSAQADYPVSMTLNTAALVSAGKMRADCADLRFANSSDSQLPYWIESGCNSAGTKAWVKVPYVPSGASTVYAYYGSPPATGTGNAASMYVAFNTNGFAEVDPDGKITVSPTAISWASLYPVNPPIRDYVYQQASASFSDYLYDFEYALTGGASSANNDAHVFIAGVGDTAGSPCNSSNHIGVELYYAPHCCGANLYPVQRTSGSETSGAGISISPGTLYYGRITKIGTTATFSLYSDAGRTANIAGSPKALTVTGATMGYVLPMSQSGSGGTACAAYNNGGWNSGYVQNVRVRKYASPEPSASPQREEIYQNPALPLGISPSNTTTYPGYAEAFALWAYNNQSTGGNFTLSCTGACTYSENPFFAGPYQNKSVNVTIMSAGAAGTTDYTINATSQANASNFAMVSVSMTVDPTKWRGKWNDAYNQAFAYRMPMTITNGGGSALADYQINVTLSTAPLISAGKMRGDCGDLRFTNGTNEMPYWIESGCNTTSTKAWVKAAYIPTGTSQVYAYYGSPSATGASSKPNTFVGTDLSGASEADPSGKVTLNSSRVDWAGLNPMNLPVDTYVYKQVPTPVAGYIYDFEYALTAGGSSHQNDAHVYFAGIGDTAGSVCSQSNQVGVYLYYAPHCCGASLSIVQRNAGAESGGPAISISPGTLYYGRLARNGTTATLALFSDAARASNIAGSPVSMAVTGATMGYLLPMSQSSSAASSPCNTGDFYYNKNGGWSSGYIQNIRVRKYASPEPSIALGSEEKRGYKLLVRRCGIKQPWTNVTAYYPPGNYSGSCLADGNGICLLEINAGSYDLRFMFADNSTAWKNGTVFS